ncbi:restriction endonuclease subunit S [uncultured Pseudokineococcus sp.]|uniref:restriction endonuclease subunit S n=1 Tax=uncultured Pseudokineococcus sp. TaxID=1642928 RepID=UPI00261986C4|nr:restriction endonuclease subunit S [uncultured Pseudokineococcus sp.]
MRDDWREVRLSDVVDIYDGPHATPQKTATGPWFLSISSLRNGRLDLTQSAHVGEEDFATWTRRVQPRRNDLLFSYETRLGEAALMPEGVLACLGRRMGLLRLRDPHVDPRFLLYAYLSPQFQAIIERRAVRGATVDRIPLNEMGKWTVRLPARDTQNAIAEVLAALDDAADGTEVVRTRATALSASLLQHASVTEMQIPLSKTAAINKGLSYKGAHLADAGMPMVNLANAATFGGFKRTGWKYYTGPYQPRHVAHGGDLLVANTDLTWKLEALGWPMLLPDDVPEALFSHHVTRIDFAPEWRHLRLPVWAHLFTTEARQRVEGMAHGTTVAALPKEALTDLEIPVLPADAPVLRQAEALLQRAWAAERESEALVRLRDALLPGLMSGEIRVGEAEERVEEVV